MRLTTCLACGFLIGLTPLLSPLPAVHAQTTSLYQNDSGAAPYVSIDTESLRTRLAARDKPVLIDVRPEEAYRAGHIAGALSMPLSTLGAHPITLPRDRDIIVYCRSGNTSRAASRFLVQSGYTRVFNLLGGYNAWMDTGTGRN